MSRKKQHLRIAAIFCLLTFLQSIVLPPMAHALTSGPTAPETSSFEPVDATDMVNLATGDLSYTIPLMEVPGPEGGYPLSLSYHAGIKPLQESSWVGLGWNVNPGAINRIVNGYPDDHRNITRSVTDYWPGGSTSTFSVGVGFGIPNTPLGIGLNVAISNDTYAGVTGDIGISLMAKIPIKNLPPGVKGAVSLGVEANGSGIGISNSVKIASGPYSATLGMNNGNAYLGASAFGVLGINMSSNSSKPDFTIAGASFYSHNNNFKLSTSSKGFALSIPLNGFYVNLGYSYRRYWIHETDQVRTYGTYYAKDSKPSLTSNGTRGITDDHIAFDCYPLLQKDLNIIDHPDPDWLWGGSYPAYDGYQVMAQGLGGNMQPYLFENGSLYRKAVIDNDANRTELAFRLPQEFYKNANFKTVNDFSNYFTLNSNSPQLNLSYQTPSANAQSYSTPSGGFNTSTFKMAGSKNIETFTNFDIRYNKSTVRAKGFIEYLGLSDTERTTGDKIHQLGGYSITSADGITYHYALPVYAYGETLKSEKPTYNSGTFYNTQNNSANYAYTWLLTAITGPDFVDRSGTNGAADGLANEGDYGYWVTFDYGKWLGDYKWRTPFTDKNIDIDKQILHVAYGKKEIYYLDAIKTRTHTALFIKDIRKDGKSVTSETNGGCTIINQIVCSNDFPFDFAPAGLPQSLLRLDKIYLLKNEDLTGTYSVEDLRNNGNLFDQVTFNGSGGCTETRTYHLSDNVIDVSDLTTSTNNTLVSNAVRIVEFDNNHYDLSPETDNSFNNSQLYTSNGSLGSKQGKLTLKGITYKGKGGAGILPKTNFTYDYTNPISRSFNIVSAGTFQGNLTGQGTINISGTIPEVYNQVAKYITGGKTYYLYLYHNWGTNDFYYRALGENLPTTAHSGTLTLTKNPPFSLSRYDAYGYYKPDFIFSNTTTGPTDIERIPTHKGAVMSDAWSLKEIETPVGAKIKMKYSPKTYNTLVKQPKTRLNIDNISRVYSGSSTKLEMTFEEYVNLDEFLNVGDVVDITYLDSNFPYSATVTVTDINDSNLSNRYIRTTYPFATSSSLGNGDRGFLGFDCADCVGNGIKVDEIEVTDGVNSRKTYYSYANGTNSYVPTFGHNPEPYMDTYGQEEYVRKFHEDLKELYALAREIPSPMVIYKNVEITEAENGNVLPQKKKYVFRTFEDDMVTITYDNVVYHPFQNDPPPANGTIDELSKRKVTIKDKTAQIGNLLSMEILDANGQVISRIVNNYADDETTESESDYAIYNNQGVIHQGFNELRTKYTYPGGSAHYTIKGVESIRKEYPSVLKSTFTTYEGITLASYNRKYDIFSGQPTETEFEDSYGQHYIEKSTPAYQQYTDMGLKISNSTNKHMLIQNTANYLYRSNGTGTTVGNPLAASVVTWEGEWKYRYLNTSNVYTDPTTPDSKKVWRQHKAYIYKDDIKADGSFNTWTPFSWTAGATNSKWLNTTEITRYDHYSKPLENLSLDGNYSATKLGYKETLPIITALPAKYVEMAFSSAEDHDSNGNWFGAEVKAPNAAAIVTTKAHTGDHSVRLNAGTQYGFNYQIPCRVYNQGAQPGEIERKKYEARVWIHESNISSGFNYLYCNYKNSAGTSLKWDGMTISNPTTIKVGEWYQLRLPIEIDNSSTLLYCTKIEIGTWVPSNAGDTYFDDFRFAPIGADVSCYVYDPVTDQVTYMLDNNHLYTQYVYDDAGRLIKTYLETSENPTGKRLLKETKYNYKRSF